MTKEQRLAIIQNYSKTEFETKDAFFEAIVLNELMFAGFKSYWKKLDAEKEINKVLDLYTFEGMPLSQRCLNYAQHCIDFPDIPGHDHIDINDGVSYIGEYYDGTPTTLLRKKGRYEITPIDLNKKGEH